MRIHELIYGNSLQEAIPPAGPSAPPSMFAGQKPPPQASAGPAYSLSSMGATTPPVNPANANMQMAQNTAPAPAPMMPREMIGSQISGKLGSADALSRGRFGSNTNMPDYQSSFSDMAKQPPMQLEHRKRSR